MSRPNIPARPNALRRRPSEQSRNASGTLIVESSRQLTSVLPHAIEWRTSVNSPTNVSGPTTLSEISAPRSMRTLGSNTALGPTTAPSPTKTSSPSQQGARSSASAEIRLCNPAQTPGFSFRTPIRSGAEAAWGSEFFTAMNQSA